MTCNFFSPRFAILVPFAARQIAQMRNSSKGGLASVAKHLTSTHQLYSKLFNSCAKELSLIEKLTFGRLLSWKGRYTFVLHTLTRSRDTCFVSESWLPVDRWSKSDQEATLASGTNSPPNSVCFEESDSSSVLSKAKVLLSVSASGFGWHHVPRHVCTHAAAILLQMFVPKDVCQECVCTSSFPTSHGPLLLSEVFTCTYLTAASCCVLVGVVLLHALCHELLDCGRHHHQENTALDSIGQVLP